MADVSKLASFPFVRMCQINGLERTENLPMIRRTSGDIAGKREWGQNSPSPVSSGLTIWPPHGRSPPFWLLHAMLATCAFPVTWRLPAAQLPPH